MSSYDRIVKCQITIAKEAMKYRADVVIHVPGRTLRTAHQHESGFSAMGQAMDKMERQLKKWNDKQVRVRIFSDKRKNEENGIRRRNEGRHIRKTSGGRYSTALCLRKEYVDCTHSNFGCKLLSRYGIGPGSG